jgi:hypothetical protein
VVGGNHEVHSLVQVVTDLRIDDVRLVTNHERLDEFHQRPRISRV